MGQTVRSFFRPELPKPTFSPSVWDLTSTAQRRSPVLKNSRNNASTYILTVHGTVSRKTQTLLYRSSKNPTRLRETNVRWKTASGKCWKPESRVVMRSFGRRSLARFLTKNHTSSSHTCPWISERKRLLDARRQQRKSSKTTAVVPASTVMDLDWPFPPPNRLKFFDAPFVICSRSSGF